MSDWLEERIKDDERHTERNRKADDYDRLAAEVQRLRLTISERHALRAVILALYSSDCEFECVALQKMLERLAGTGNTPPPHATQPQGSVPGEGSVPDSRTENEPVAWWLKGTEYDTGCEYEYVSLVKESADAAAKEGGTVTPLYRAPTLTDEERIAVEHCCDVIDAKAYGDSATLRRLLERMK